MIIDSHDLNKSILIIAELSANHNGNIDIALETIKAAKKAGANAIKLQTYRPNTITIDCDHDDFIIKDTLWNGQKLYDLYEKAHTPWEWHNKLFECAKNEGLICFSSPFDQSSVDFLEKFNVPAYKIASFEITDIPLIEYVASKNKPIILSTGISELKDIELAIETCHKAGNYNISLLKCTSSYPAPIDEANLIMINDFAQKFNVTPGLSDHTIGSTVPILSVAMGAKIIEKHFILDRSLGGPDAEFSMNEIEFSNMVKCIRDAESALGRIDYTLSKKQIKGRDFSRSLYVVEDIKKGELFTTRNVKSIRPGFGLHPKYLKDLVGKTATKDLIKGTRTNKSMLD